MERSFTKPEKARSLDALIKSIKPVEIVTRSGLYLRKGWVADIDLGRLDRVVERITKGLFFHRSKIQLPSTHGAKSLSESGFTYLPEQDRIGIQQTLHDLFVGIPTITIGNDVFSYKAIFTEQDPNVSAWLMSFYNKVSFFSVTIPNNPPKEIQS